MANTLATRKQSEAIRRKMQLIRNQLPEDVDSARARARQLTDWKYHMARHPWPVLAGVACLGYWLVPSPSGSKHQSHRSDFSDSRPPGRPGKRFQLGSRSEQAEVPKRSFVGGIVAAAATMALRSVGSMATRYVTDQLTSAAGLGGHPAAGEQPPYASKHPAAGGFPPGVAGAGTPAAASAKATLYPDGPAWHDQPGIDPHPTTRKP